MAPDVWIGLLALQLINCSQNDAGAFTTPFLPPLIARLVSPLLTQELTLWYKVTRIRRLQISTLTQKRKFTMENQPIKRALVYTPIVMSLIAFANVLESLAEFGVDPAHYQKDEGWQAHLWQLLMVLQLPIILLCVAAVWRSFTRNLSVVALQLTLWAANIAIVYFLKL